MNYLFIKYQVFFGIVYGLGLFMIIMHDCNFLYIIIVSNFKLGHLLSSLGMLSMDLCLALLCLGLRYCAYSFIFHFFAIYILLCPSLSL